MGQILSYLKAERDPNAGALAARIRRPEDDENTFRDPNESNALEDLEQRLQRLREGRVRSTPTVDVYGVD